jgi:hypothetical protein
MGGAVLAAALSFVLVTFAAAIGLSATSPWPHSGLGVKAIAALAVFWALAQQIGALMVGGYVAGRMGSRWYEAGHQARFRDGLHGALVWGVSAPQRPIAICHGWSRWQARRWHGRQCSRFCSVNRQQST